MRVNFSGSCPQTSRTWVPSHHARYLRVRDGVPPRATDTNLRWSSCPQKLKVLRSFYFVAWSCISPKRAFFQKDSFFYFGGGGKGGLALMTYCMVCRGKFCRLYGADVCSYLLDLDFWGVVLRGCVATNVRWSSCPQAAPFYIGVFVCQVVAIAPSEGSWVP